MENLYDILNVNKNASPNDIKSAYKKLALKYHPDKNSDDTTNKFIQIKTAYEILKDPHKRKQYDATILDVNFHNNLYDYIKKFFVDTSPEYKNIIDSFTNKYYKSEEDQLRQDINNLNINNIFENINKINKYLPSTITKKISFLDKYLNNTVLITILEQSYDIPLYNPQHILVIDNKNITVNIEYDQDPQFKELNDSNLLIVHSISLYKFLYGGQLSIKHLDGEIIDLQFSGFIESVPIMMLPNKGLPKIVNDQVIRGNLHVYFVIEGINDGLVNDYTKKVKEIIGNLFN